MKITYISHSGFAVELENHIFLFDYYKGEIPKWPTGADCNSADIVFVGSNPALPTFAEIAQSIEH